MASEGSRHGGQSWTEELIAQNAANSGGEEEAPKTLSEEVQYPAVERKLRSWYYHWVSAACSPPCTLASHVGGKQNPGVQLRLQILSTRQEECKLMTWWLGSS